MLDQLTRLISRAVAQQLYWFDKKQVKDKIYLR